MGIFKKNSGCEYCGKGCSEMADAIYVCSRCELVLDFHMKSSAGDGTHKELICSMRKVEDYDRKNNDRVEAEGFIAAIEKNGMKCFFKTMSETSARAIYGVSEVMDILLKNPSTVQRVFVSTSLPNTVLDNIIDVVERFDVNVYPISRIRTREGVQLWEMGGIAAVLKEDLDKKKEMAEMLKVTYDVVNVVHCDKIIKKKRRLLDYRSSIKKKDLTKWCYHGKRSYNLYYTNLWRDTMKKLTDEERDALILAAKCFRDVWTHGEPDGRDFPGLNRDTVQYDVLTSAMEKLMGRFSR